MKPSLRFLDLWQRARDLFDGVLGVSRFTPSRTGFSANGPDQPEPWMEDAVDSLLRKIERDRRFQFLPCVINGEPSGVIAVRDVKNGIPRLCPVFVMITPGMKFATMREPAGNA
jgi:hypothetical protein